MHFSRRQLLVGLAAVTAATSARASPAAKSMPSVLSPRELALAEEHRWLTGALLRSVIAGEWAVWAAGAPDERPARWRLARCYTELRELRDPSDLECVLQREVTGLWQNLCCAADSIEAQIQAAEKAGLRFPSEASSPPLRAARGRRGPSAGRARCILREARPQMVISVDVPVG